MVEFPQVDGTILCCRVPRFACKSGFSMFLKPTTTDRIEFFDLIDEYYIPRHPRARGDAERIADHQLVNAADRHPRVHGDDAVRQECPTSP